MNKTYDFSGWATRNDIKCSDGRIIRRDAFKENDGQTVPLVWNHSHNDPLNVLGHALLKNEKDGVRVYGTFNDTEQGRNAKALVQHGDVTSLSIWANKLKQHGDDVLHGLIREVSLVLAGANPGALIDTVISHGDEIDDEAIIYTGEELALSHSEEEESKEEMQKENLEHAESEASTESKEKTVQDVIDSMTEEQKNVLYALVGAAVEDKEEADEEENVEHNDEGGTNVMKHNVFENEEVKQNDVLSHAEQETIIKDVKKFGSMKESFMAHAEEYGIENIEYLFPEARQLTREPQFISRDMGWVSKVMAGVHKSPFSRIKGVYANITEDEARAKGYIKGKMKKEEVFPLLKRTTTPTTVYKKQKMDRDDWNDITDFDVVAWLKREMRMMLDEELARAYLFGDGRSASDDDKINEQNIRPIWTDEDLFTIHSVVDGTTKTTADDRAKEFIRVAIKSRKNYKGSGNPVLFINEDLLSDLLLLTDEMGRDLYTSEAQLATKLRVKEIITVPVMEDLNRTVDSKKRALMGLIVNLGDYTVGADKGGAVNMFDDFDIDYNQQKYLIETRCSGMMNKPYSAIAIELETNA